MNLDRLPVKDHLLQLIVGQTGVEDGALSLDGLNRVRNEIAGEDPTPSGHRRSLNGLVGTLARVRHEDISLLEFKIQS